MRNELRVGAAPALGRIISSILLIGMPAAQISVCPDWLAEHWLQCYPCRGPLVRSVLLSRLVKIAHWLICIQQRVIDGAKAVEAFLIELR
jgi:hypothetical protein